ncbi:transcription antitermination protein NusB, partial [Parafannyhessea sp. LCP19S3_B1]|uniref:transcription antitermination protein NusB n=2 Tax=unclassified Parafannyhessea TaxID=2847323 RepID=UPI003F9DAC7C
MARLAPARRAALRLCAACRQRDARARELLRTSDVMDGLDPRDRALATRLVLGVQRARGLCDAVVDAHLAHGHLEPRVRDALRMSAFELLYLGTPTQVAVSQGVELAAVASRRARGLANAVLRRIAEGDVPAMEAARGRLRA